MDEVKVRGEGEQWNGNVSLFALPRSFASLQPKGESMKVTKKTRLLKKPLPKVNLTSFAVHMSESPDYAEFELGVENCEGIRDYQDYGGGRCRITVRVDFPGEGYQMMDADMYPGSDVFTGGINNVHAGDVLKMSVEIDPSKVSEYEAGTMELTATVV